MASYIYSTCCCTQDSQPEAIFVFDFIRVISNWKNMMIFTIRVTRLIHHFVLLWDEHLPFNDGHADLHGPCCSSLILLDIYLNTRIEEHAPSYFLFKIIFRYCTRDVSHWLSCTPTTSKIISKIKNKVDILNFYLNQWFRKEEDTYYVLLTWFIELREWFFYLFVFYVPWFSQSPSRIRKFGHTRPWGKSLLPALYKHPVYELRWSFSAQTPLSVSLLGFLASLLCHTRMAYENLTTKQTAK